MLAFLSRWPYELNGMKWDGMRRKLINLLFLCVYVCLLLCLRGGFNF